MNLFFLRHASAGNRRVNPLLDVKRPLDKDGKQHCLRLAHLLVGMKVQFDLVVSSPLKRSLQTASMIGMETGHEAKVLLSNALAPSATFVDFQKLLADCGQAENLLVVGHNPNLTAFLGCTIGGGRMGRGASVRLRKGSLARVNMDRGTATLMWLMDPRMVRSLYTTSTVSSRLKTSRK